MEQPSTQEEILDEQSLQALLQEAYEQIYPFRQGQPWSEEKWNEVTRQLQACLKENPYNGDIWGLYGMACEKVERHEDALAAYRKTMEYGSNYPAEAAYWLARTLVRLGKDEEALTWLETSFRFALRMLKAAETESVWDGLREHPRFQRLVLALPGGDIDRVAGWQHDLHVLTTRMEQQHFDLFGQFNLLSLTPARWQEAVTDLEQRLPSLADHEIVAELLQLMVLAGDGHSKLHPFDVKEGYLAQHELLSLWLPVMFYAFQDGLFLRAAAPRYRELVGARVLTLGNLPVEQAMERVSHVVARDNPMTVLSESPRMLNHPALLHALGISEQANQLTVQLVHEGGKPFSATLEGEMKEINWRRWGGAEPEGWISMHDFTQELPLWLKDPGNWYWFEYLPERRVIYCQFNQVGSKDDEPLERFCEQLFGEIEARCAQALLLDLRLNGGGDLTTYKPLLHSIMRSSRINRKGHLFVLIGRRTFSAAQHLSGQLEIHTEATFVGEPTGSRPNMIGEGNQFSLPFSGIRGSISNLFWQSTYAFDRRQWIPPHRSVSLTSSDFRSNRDPVLEAILKQF